jgi:translation elongation factor EF-1alpha
MGHLLFLLGSVSQKLMHKYEKESKKIGKQSFMYAWVLGRQNPHAQYLLLLVNGAGWV